VGGVLVGRSVCLLVGGLTKLISVYFSIGQRFCGAIDYKAMALKPSDQPISQRQWKLNCTPTVHYSWSTLRFFRGKRYS